MDKAPIVGAICQCTRILVNLLPSDINCELSAGAGASLFHPGRSKPQHKYTCTLCLTDRLLASFVTLFIQMS